MTYIPDILVSCKEAARFLGVTPATISTKVRRKILTKRTIDGVTGIPLRELMKATRREAVEPQFFIHIK